MLGCRTLSVVAVAALVLPVVGSGQTPKEGVALEEKFESADIDANGSLLLTTSDKRTIIIPKRGEQTVFRQPLISSEGTAVGAQAEFPNCCTSYDIPLQLVVYARGREHRFTGNGWPIFEWHFADGGRRLAFGQEPVHFGCAIHYELREIDTERLIDSADIPQPCGQIRNPRPVQIPKWVQALRAEGR